MRLTAPGNVLRPAFRRMFLDGLPAYAMPFGEFGLACPVSYSRPDSFPVTNVTTS